MKNLAVEYIPVGQWVYTLWLKYFSNLTLPTARQAAQSSGLRSSIFVTFTAPSGMNLSVRCCGREGVEGGRERGKGEREGSDAK